LLKLHWRVFPAKISGRWVGPGDEKLTFAVLCKRRLRLAPGFRSNFDGNSQILTGVGDLTPLLLVIQMRDRRPMKRRFDGLTNWVVALFLMTRRYFTCPSCVKDMYIDHLNPLYFQKMNEILI